MRLTTMVALVGCCLIQPLVVTAVSLDEKIGQMLMVGFRGYAIPAESTIAKAIQKHHLGGVVLYDYDIQTKTYERNINDGDQLKKLIFSAQKLAKQPLLIAIDHEGGKVIRLKENRGFPPTLSAQKIATYARKEKTARFEEMAQTIHDLGFNINLAPVVDLNIFPESPAIGQVERSFSKNPEIVIQHARFFIQAHHKYNVLTTLKHFPGHGSALADSHWGITDVTKTWQEQELEPYAELIKSNQVDAVLTAHVFNTNLDKDLPATLSKKIITGLLREKLGFQGVVISDDMQMGAITALAYQGKPLGQKQAIQLALDAGIDILLFANNLVYDKHIVKKSIEHIKALIDEGSLSEDRIDLSYQRILKLKQQLPK